MTMKNISELVEQYKSLPAVSQEQKNLIQLSDADKQIVNSVLERLQVSFPAWRVAFPTDRSWKLAKQEWTVALVNAECVTEQMLSLGFKNARKSDIPFFPSPGMFIKWCQPTPENFGMPSAEEALKMIIRRTIKPDTHPIVMAIAKKTRWERQTLNADEYKKVFEREYQILSRRLMAGGNITDEMPKGIENKTKPKFMLTATGYIEVKDDDHE
jgi:hypothetical protein